MTLTNVQKQNAKVAAASYVSIASKRQVRVRTVQ